jgi:hypothetical protein
MASLKGVTLTFGKGVDGEEVVLHREHIAALTNLTVKAPKLEKLKLICGFWEDIQAEDLQNLLVGCSSTLEHFSIAGNLHGCDLRDRQLTVTVPKLPKILSFTMGSSYDFEEVIEEARGSQTGQSTSAQAQRTNIISLTEKHLVAFIVEFPHIMSTLETICFGNLVEIEKIHPKTFPVLRVFRIGSAWNKSVDIPIDDSTTRTRRFPTFPLVRELQLPDCLKDEFFVQKIPQLFPAMRKVWIKLPSVKCLRQFFHVMRGSGIDELYLQTQYDFEGTLESALLSDKSRSKPSAKSKSKPRPSTSSKTKSNARPSTSSQAANGDPSSSPNIQQLLKLKNPADGDKVLNDFVRYHNIEFPISSCGDNGTLETFEGIGALKHLKVLELEHIPRKLRIPTKNTLPHYHQDQEFHPYLTLGFEKYPLDRRFFSHDLQELKALEKFRYGSNFKVGIINVLYGAWDEYIPKYTNRYFNTSLYSIFHFLGEL